MSGMGSKVSVYVFPRKAQGEGGSRLSVLPFRRKDFGVTAGTGYPVVPVTVDGSTGVFRTRFPGVSPTEIMMRCNGPVCPSRLDGRSGGRIKRCARGMVHRVLVGGGPLARGWWSRR